MAVDTAIKPPADTATAYPAGTSQSTINAQVSTSQDSTPASNARPGERNTDLENTNRTKLLSSGQLLGSSDPQLAQEKINLATYGVENPSFGASVSSDPTRAALADKTQTVTDGLAAIKDQQAQVAQPMVPIPTPTYKEDTDFSSQYQDARTANQNLETQQLANINADFATRTNDQIAANRVSSGYNAKTLARMNALGTGASGLAFLQQVDTQNQQELNKLLIQKQSVLLQASQAAQNKDIDLLDKLVAESHAVTNQYNQLQTQRVNDAISTNDQLMQQNQFGWDSQDRAAKKLSDLATLNTDYTTNKSQIDQLQQDAGLPSDYYANLAKASKKQQAVTDAKNAADKAKAELDNQQTINEIRNATPNGQSFKIGDTVYTGWKDNSSLQTDSEGNVIQLTRDPNTGTITKVPLGKIGASGDGWSVQKTDNGTVLLNAKTGETRAITYGDPTANGTPGNPGGAFMDPGNLGGFNSWAATVGAINPQETFSNNTVHGTTWPSYAIDGKKGDPIKPFLQPGENGTVTAVYTTDAGPLGKHIEVTDSQGRVGIYSHFDNINVTQGQQITADTLLGGMGSTGNILTEQGHPGKLAQVTDEQRAAGVGAHLDFVMKTPSKTVGTISPSNTSDLSKAFNFVLAGNDKAVAVNSADKVTFNRLIASGDTQGAKDFLKTSALHYASKPDQDTQYGFANTVNSITHIQDLLKQYVDKTGDTGILTQGIEQAANKIGQTSNPELASIRTAITLAQADYINAISGKQVTDAERQVYGAVFPSIGNGSELNNAQIGALLQAVQSKQTEFYKERLGASNYDKVFGGTQDYGNL